jgi:hypothetical protein
MKLTYAIFGAAVLALGACSGMPRPSGPDAGTTEELITATATIDSVNTTDRIVALHEDDTGQAYTVYANDGIPNLDQLKAGDVVVVEYYEATTLSMANPSSPDASSAAVAGTAPKGTLPGGVAVETETLVVQMVNYDTEDHIATFTTPDGLQRRTAVPPNLQAFASELQRSDMVEITMTQAVAVSIAPAGS